MIRPRSGDGGVAAPLALAVLVAAIYGQTRAFKFLSWDDGLYLTDAPVVSGGLTAAGAAWAFTTFHAVNWHPLTWLSHMLDVSLFGMDAGAHHLVNAGLHLLNALLLHRFLRETTGRAGESFVAAAFFAVHPLQVESVAWIAERKTLLCAFFLFLSLWRYGRYAAAPSASRYGSVLVCFALSLLAKPMSVTLPFVLLLLDFWPLGRLRFPGKGAESLREGPPSVPIARILAEKTPFFLLSAFSCAMTLLAQARGAALVTLESMPIRERLGNALAAYAGYLSKAAWPTGLAFFYPVRPLPETVPAAVLSALLLFGASWFAIRQARIRPWIPVGWFWFLGTLVPMIGIVQVGMQAMADRYAYLPLVGLPIAACYSAGEAVRRLRAPAAATAIAAIPALLLLATASWFQAGHWRDSGSIFRRAAAVTRDNWAAQNGLGKVAFEEGRYEDALRHLQEAARLAPGVVEIRNSVGVVLSRMGRTGEAEAQYRDALRLRPEYADARINLGALLAGRGDLTGAESQLRETLRLSPGHPEAHGRLGDVLAKQGRIPESILEFRESIRIRPGNADVHLGLGMALLRTSDLDGAVRHLREVVRMRPGSPEARNNLGVALARQGAVEEAAGQFREALRLRPGYGGARRNLERLLGGRTVSGSEGEP